ncbi:MAG: hypothetical protein HOH33_17045 [Verrucomicrobia bacterium]|nr:hypothetical protein [Verrucomicrobiota bacterium]
MEPSRFIATQVEENEKEVLVWQIAHHASTDQKALGSVEEFLTDCSTEPFVSLMDFRKLLFLEKLQNYPVALDGFDKLRSQLTIIPITESGMPIDAAL